MRYETPSRETTFGYLSALQSADYGYFGGYLILSAYGRPLEFHCTSPVRPSRALEILYGPSLQPYLLGEQIASALFDSAKLTPHVILTDRSAMLAARAKAKAPMALLLAKLTEIEGETAAPQIAHGNASTAGEAPSKLPSFENRFIVGDHDLLVPTGYESEQESVIQTLRILIQHVDLPEPFDRIHEAIREAQRIGQRTAESNGQAA